MIFSEKLFVLRKSKGLTQEDMAEHLSVSRQAITKWESVFWGKKQYGKRGCPSME
jgi:transcriptional regulator with XRE-family HTH domain